jgi:hypothetical protein
MFTPDCVSCAVLKLRNPTGRLRSFTQSNTLIIRQFAINKFYRMPKLTHQISLSEAVDMTTLYRANRPENFPICETFEKASIQSLLNQSGAVSFRIYYGMKTDMSVHAVLVAADSSGNDILPTSASLLTDGDGDGEILEDSVRCPVNCPPESPLNTGG